MLTLVGDDEIDIMELPNGMKIYMDFGIDETGSWGWGVESAGNIGVLDYMTKKII